MIRTVLHIFHGARDKLFYKGVIIQKVIYKIFQKSALEKKVPFSFAEKNYLIEF